MPAIAEVPTLCSRDGPFDCMGHHHLGTPSIPAKLLLTAVFLEAEASANSWAHGTLLHEGHVPRGWGLAAVARPDSASGRPCPELTAECIRSS